MLFINLRGSPRAYKQWKEVNWHGSEEERLGFLQEHRHPCAYTDLDGIMVQAAVQYLQVVASFLSNTSYLSQVDLHLVIPSSSAEYQSHFYLGPEEPRASLYMSLSQQHFISLRPLDMEEKVHPSSHSPISI